LELGRHHRRHHIKPLTRFKVGCFTVSAFEGHHNVSVLGFQIEAGGEKLVYVTDTAYCEYTFPGITHLIVEANYDPCSLEESAKTQPGLVRRIITDHLGVENVIKMLEENDLSKLKEVRLAHLSDTNANEETIVELVKEVLPENVILTVAKK
jgi:phosphoribosyl 1,2-cyclic phosphodiesterase